MRKKEYRITVRGTLPATLGEELAKAQAAAIRGPKPPTTARAGPRAALDRLLAEAGQPQESEG